MRGIGTLTGRLSGSMVRKEHRSRSESLDSLELKDTGQLTTDIAPSGRVRWHFGSAASLELDVNGQGQVRLRLPPTPPPEAEDKSKVTGVEISADGWNG